MNTEEGMGLQPGDRVLVTGGSGGIGRALCERLAAAGCRPVVGYCKNRNAAEAVAEATGGDIWSCDLADPEAIARSVKLLTAGPGPLAGLVLGASPAPLVAPFGQIEGDGLEMQFRVNVLGSFQLPQAVSGAFFKRLQRGILVGILTSAMGDGDKPVATRNMGGYVVAKYGLAGVLAVARAELPWLRVVSVAPGFTETAMLDGFGERFLELMRRQLPEKRFGAPDQVAADITARLF
ncbi:MAG: SDR family oxidoreductase [Rhodospirillales bacterium]|nr:SDR family oxidoreductase [Rhodospirillales bacterium]